MADRELVPEPEPEPERPRAERSLEIRNPATDAVVRSVAVTEEGEEGRHRLGVKIEVDGVMQIRRQEVRTRDERRHAIPTDEPTRDLKERDRRPRRDERLCDEQ